MRTNAPAPPLPDIRFQTFPQAPELAELKYLTGVNRITRALPDPRDENLRPRTVVHHLLAYGPNVITRGNGCRVWGGTSSTTCFTERPSTARTVSSRRPSCRRIAPARALVALRVCVFVCVCVCVCVFVCVCV